MWCVTTLFPGLFSFCPPYIEPTHSQLTVRDDRKMVERGDGVENERPNKKPKSRNWLQKSERKRPIILSRVQKNKHKAVTCISTVINIRRTHQELSFPRKLHCYTQQPYQYAAKLALAQVKDCGHELMLLCLQNSIFTLAPVSAQGIHSPFVNDYTQDYPRSSFASQKRYAIILKSPTSTSTHTLYSNQTVMMPHCNH